MQLILPLIAIGIIAVLSVFLPKKSFTIKDAVTPTTTSSPSKSPTPTESITPAQTIQTSPTASTSTSSSDFIYPRSKVISNSSGKITLESNDSPTSITDWYKTKIKEKGINATSFVTTNTNGKILNKLAGANSSINVEVEIQKKEGESTSHITISFK